MPPGRVDEISAELLARIRLGPTSSWSASGAVASSTRPRRSPERSAPAAAAIPTTLSGAEMTPFHRTPAGVEGARLVRPALVLADPDLMASARRRRSRPRR